MGILDFFFKKRDVEKPYQCPFRLILETSYCYEGWDQLNSNEQAFFAELEHALIEANIKPSEITLCRLGSKSLRVRCSELGFIVGNINLQPEIVPDKYAVKRTGGKRALRVFTSEEEAIQYKEEKHADEIEFRPGFVGEFYMQIPIYGNGGDDVKHFSTYSLEACINKIPQWIRYIKHCIRLSYLLYI